MSADPPRDDADVPVHVAGVGLRTDGDRNLLVADHLAEPILLDGTALALWELCDGETTLGDIVGASVRLFDARPEVLRHDITAAFDQLVDSGVVEWLRPQ